MDIARMVVGVAADTTDLTAGFSRSMKEVSGFAKAANTALGAFTVDQAVAALKTLKVSVKEVATETGGIRVFSAVGKDVESASAIFRKMGVQVKVISEEAARSVSAIGNLAGQSAKVAGGFQGAERAARGLADQASKVRLPADLNASLAEADRLLRQRITLLTQGAQVQATQQDSLRALGTMYTSVSREIGSSNVGLERRIVLEKELVRIRAAFASSGSGGRVDPIASGTANATASLAAMRATAAAADQMNRSTKAATQSLVTLNATSGRFSPIGNRLANASISVAFALDGIAAGGDRAESGLRQALRAVSALGPAFGPQGLLISGVAASVNAIVGLFTRAREEMEKTQKEFSARFSDTLRAGPGPDMVAFLRDLEEGDRGGTKSIFGGFTGGLKDLEAKFLLAKGAADALGLSVRVSSDNVENLAKAGAFRFPAVRAFLEADEKLRALQKRLAEVTQSILNPPTPQKGTGLLPDFEIKTNILTIDDQIRDLRARITTLLTAEAQVGTTPGLILPQLPASLSRLYAVANSLLDQQINKQSEASVTLRTLIGQLKESKQLAQQRIAEGDFSLIPTIDFTKLTKDIGKVELPDIDLTLALKPLPDSIVGELERQLQKVATARGQLDFSKLTGDKAFVEETAKNLKRVEDMFKASLAKMANDIRSSGLPQHLQDVLIGQVNAAQASFDTGAATAKAASSVKQFVDSGRGLLQVADSMGRVNQSTRRTLDGVLSLVDALDSLNAARALKDFAQISALLSGGIAAIGAIASIGAGLFGESESEKRANELRKQNNDLIAKLSQDLRGFTNSIGNQARVARAVSDPTIQAIGNDRVASLLTPFGTLAEELKRFGLTFADINRIAKENGIQLLNDKGQIVAGTLQQLADALGFNIELLTKFGRSLEDQRDTAELSKRVLGDDRTPIATNLDFLKTLAPALFEKFFAGVDPTNVGDVQASLRALTQAFINGTLDAKLFGDLLSKGDLKSIILATQDGIDALGKAADTASSRLLNIPKGLKLEAIRFDATAAIPRSSLNPSTLGVQDSTPITRASPPPTVNAPTTFQSGAITINVYAAPGQSPREIAGATLREFQSEARAAGHGRDWSRVQRLN